MASKARKVWVFHVNEYEAKHADEWPNLHHGQVLATLPHNTARDRIEVALIATFQSLILTNDDDRFDVSQRRGVAAAEWNPWQRHVEISPGGLPGLAATYADARMVDGTLEWTPLYRP